MPRIYEVKVTKTIVTKVPVWLDVEAATEKEALARAVKLMKSRKYKWPRCNTKETTIEASDPMRLPEGG